MFFLRARAFVCGVGAGFDQLSVAIKDIGKPAPNRNRVRFAAVFYHGSVVVKDMGTAPTILFF